MLKDPREWKWTNTELGEHYRTTRFPQQISYKNRDRGRGEQIKT